MKFEGKVLIIGAGVAGIYAGHVLSQKGIDFQILEASDRIGGRLGKLGGFADYPLDLGGEWLHGKKSLMGKLVKETGTHISKDKSKERYWFRKQLVKETPVDVWELFEEENLPDMSYLDYSVQQGLKDEYKHIVEAVAGDFGAAAANVSAYWKIREERKWSSGNKDYKFSQTYFDLVARHLAKPILNRIQLNTAITQIDYRGKQIELKDASQASYSADKVIISVPIPILQDGDIEFVPALPNAKVAAFNKIGMDAGMKVFLKFSKRFYHENIIGGKYSAAYADEQIGKAGQDHVLMAFVMGEQASYLSGLPSEQAIVETLLAELDEMYQGKASKTFMDAYVIDWTKEPFIRGAYSYSTVGIGDARSIAAQSVDDKLFFAGEAMNLNGHHQTVHGAAETGLGAVRQILG
ncbi:MAG: flavin monoamine oxidase family protein [Bacteroidia bacterium]